MIDNGGIVKFLKSKDYEMINNQLGSGAFGKTVLIKDPFIDELFVAKKYEPLPFVPKKEFYDSFLKEIKIMYKLNHPNVVRIYNYYAFEAKYTGFIIMEYIDGVDISEFFENYNWPFEDLSLDELFVQLIDGFQYIESQGIVHRDIREGNILIDKHGIAKIIDFGLGKTQSPVEYSPDSLRSEINRTGLDALPEEYFQATYDSQTDMFYFAELFNRLLRTSGNQAFFSYQSILDKMMQVKKANRFSSFAEIKEAIGKKDFTELSISDEDRDIYQSFSNAVHSCVACFTQEKEFVTNVGEFVLKLKSVLEKNCFEYFIQNVCDLIYCVVKKGFKYYRNKEVECDHVRAFYDWFVSLTPSSQSLIFNNIIQKLSTIRTEVETDELPF